MAYELLFNTHFWPVLELLSSLAFVVKDFLILHPN